MLDLQAVNNPDAFSNKMMTRLGLKRSREFENTGDENSSKKQKRIEEIKVEKTRKEEIKGEGEKEKVLGENSSDWKQKEWTRKKAGIESTEGKVESKGVRWSKYTVMKRRTESLVDLAQRKGVFFRQEQLGGTKAKKQPIVQRQGRTRSRSEGGLLKELLTWNHRKAERDFMDHDGQDMQ